MASLPLTEDGASFKSCIDESCWTPLLALHDISFTYANDSLLVVPSDISEKCIISGSI
jgi:hypothetical protein